MRSVPAFLSVDVEPEAFQLAVGAELRWQGFDAMVGFLEGLRGELSAASETPARFGWYFRTDPQIAEVYGRADHAMSSLPWHIDRLVRQGDYFGVHTHPIRWSAAHGQWVHDFADAAWLRTSTRFALEAWARWSGAPARRLRFGAGFMSNEILAVADEQGVEIDLTLEPVAGWGLRATEVPSAVDSSPIIGCFPDCRGAPRVPFRPARDDFRVPAVPQARRRGPVMIPLTTGTTQDGDVEVLYPGLGWPSLDGFWDRVERELAEMQRPYLSLAIRTDASAGTIARQVRALFSALPGHRLSRRLRFVDPLEALPEIL